MPNSEKSLIYYSNICSTTRCQCNRLGSEGCSPFHGIFHYQQCMHSLAFFFLSRWKYGFIKGDGLLGRIFSNVFFSLLVPKLLSGKRHSEKPGKIWWRDQKEREGQWGGTRRSEGKGCWGGGKLEQERYPPPSPVSDTNGSAEGNSSKQGLCFQTQRQQNTERCPETSKWAILTSEGLQMLEELSESGRGGPSTENRRYQQAVNNQCGNQARKAVSSQNASRHQITEGFSQSVKSHLITFICWKLNSLKVYQLLWC